MIISRACGQLIFGGGGGGGGSSGENDKRGSFEDQPRTGLLPRSCRVPTGKASFCVPLKQCPYVRDLLKSLQKPYPDNVNLIIRVRHKTYWPCELFHLIKLVKSHGYSS